MFSLDFASNSAFFPSLISQQILICIKEYLPLRLHARTQSDPARNNGD